MAGISSKVGNFAFAKQSAKGTPAASPIIRVFSNGSPSLGPVKNRDRYPMTDSSQDLAGSFTSSMMVSGDIPVWVHPEVASFLFAAVMGAVAETGSTPNYTHTITPANDVPYLTIWRNVGDVIFEKFQDCKITSLRITGAAGGALQITLSVIGIKSTFVPGGDPVLTPITTQPYIYPEAFGAIKIDTVAYPIDSIEFGVNRNLSPWQADDYFPTDIDPGQREFDFTFATRLTGAIAEPLDYRKFNYGSDAGTAQDPALATRAVDVTWTRNANLLLQILLPVVTYAAVPVNADAGGDPIHVEVACSVERPASGAIATVVAKDQRATAYT